MTLPAADTETDALTEARRALHDRWVVTVAYHPNDAHIGLRATIDDGGTYRLGRHGDLFVHAFNNVKASRRHAQIRCDADALRLEDCGSTNGTYVNAERRQDATLEPGDVVSIGRIHLVVSRGGSQAEASMHPVIVGRSERVGVMVDRVRLVANRDLAVLVQGETGTGKELVARALHEESGRSGNLITLSCPDVPDGVHHSELFGHMDGAFSDARHDREGLVSAAAKGTLFLDEIADASPALQATLLRLLEERTYRPVGADGVRTCTARIVAATHTPLADAVERGAFREDLFHRLQRWVITVPPLRERREDVVVLARHFLARLSGEPPALGRSLALSLLRHDYPGNVRELRSLVERAFIEARGAKELTAIAGWQPAHVEEPPPHRRHKKRPSAAELKASFREAGYNATALAELLGVGRATLYRWLHSAGLDPRAMREETHG